MTNKCIKCGATLRIKDIEEVIPPVLEDPVKIIVFRCSECDYLNGKAYEM